MTKSGKLSALTRQIQDQRLRIKTGMECGKKLPDLTLMDDVYAKMERLISVLNSE